MTLSPSDIGHALLALSLLLLSAHVLGYLFQRMRQPPVIGEILGGLLLGPTGLKAVSPEAYSWVFESNAATQVLMGGVYNLGLQLLMFCSGLEIRGEFSRADRRTALWIAVTGTLLPFALAFAMQPLFGFERHLGTAGRPDAFALVFAIAIAVTSIPVISRILNDLGILGTPFARIVLTAAVLEDIALYVVLAIAVAMATGAHPAGAFGLPHALGWTEGAPGLVYHSIGSLAFFGLAVALGPGAIAALERFKYNFAFRRSAVGHLLAVMLAFTFAAVALGLTPMFGAFAGGIAVGQLRGTDRRPTEEAAAAVKNFSFGFFVPMYFAIVGLRLDLLRDFEPAFFAGFLAAACLAKLASVYLGARLAGERRRGALNFAAAMNARGGPGIVLASVALDAGIVNGKFYATLVMLAVVTSLLAGAWLDRAVRGGASPR